MISRAFDYIERKNTDKQDTVVSYTIEEYPKDLQKKITLLHHFRGYLEADAKPAVQKEIIF
jgi:polo-like kinase 1